MSPHDDSMPLHLALQSVLVLAAWDPPEGVCATVSCSASPDHPSLRRVNVSLSASESSLCVIAVTGLPEPLDLDALTEAANQILRDAWDEPACVALGPILDTTQFGRDMP